MPRGKKTTQTLLIIGILVIAVNLRPALSSIGPLIEMIRVDYGLSGSMLGLLTTLPLLAFGVVSAFAPLFTKRFGLGETLLGAMALLTIGIAVRSIHGVSWLYLGTLMAGVAIAFGNVLIPALTKRSFPHRAGAITGMYSAVMAIGAALAAGLSVPLTRLPGVGWRGSLVVWAALAALAFVVWRPRVRDIERTRPRRTFPQALAALGRTRLVWQIAVFMGLQSLSFYVVLAWLPALLIEAGYEPAFSGWMLSLSQATGILGSALIPTWAVKRPNQRGVMLTLVLIEAVSLLGLMFLLPGFVALWASLIGFVLGGTFGLALLIIVLRSTDSDTAAELSGVAQSIGYLIAATGPFLAGMIFDFTGEWNYALLLLLVVAGGKLYVGWGAAKAQTI